MPAVEVSRKPNDQVVARKGARIAYGEHRRFGATHREAHPFRAGNQTHNLFGPGNLKLMAGPVVGALVDLFGNRGGHLRVTVTQQQGTMAHPVVEQLVAVDVPLPSPFGSLDIDRKRHKVPTIVRNTPGDRLA